MVFPVSSEIFDLVRDPGRIPDQGSREDIAPGRISEENKLNATTQQFITAKVSGCVLKQGSKTHSSLRPSNLQLQNEPALMSCRIRAVEHRKCVAGPAGAHPGLQDRILLNYTRSRMRMKYARKPSIFYYVWKQNRRQKVVNRGALRCAEALRSCKGGLTFKFDKNSTNM